MTNKPSQIKQSIAIQIEQWPVGRLVPYARNPRTHSDAQVAQIAASIREFGFNNPILVDMGACEAMRRVSVTASIRSRGSGTDELNCGVCGQELTLPARGLGRCKAGRISL